ncbi:DUF7282 domain-containing protein [Halobacterium yunchengense]|uniref:DUF7282 domain-containing protein n=1 Tax=Halobacterium yunchengense TaxID=3108497 RepID=UPI0030097BA9
MKPHTLAVLTVAAAVALWGGAAAAAHAPSTDATSDAAAVGGAPAADAATAVQPANASVTFSNQSVDDGAVTVESVTLPEGGYVTVHDSGLLEGDALGSVVGVSEYLEPGTHDDVTVPLYEGVEGVDFEDAAPTGEQTLVAMPHLETTGDETFDFVASDGEDDGPYVANETVVTDEATVTFAGEDGDGERADRGLVVDDLTAPPYATTNETVTVNATLRNTDDDERTEDVAFRLEGGAVDLVVHQAVTVPAGETETVTFDVDTSGVAEDEYIHGVTTANSSEFTTITVSDSAAVDFDDQDSDGETVTVDAVFLPEGGYVTVHDSGLLEGDALGSVVGVSEYLEPGYHADVTVPLYEGVEGADFDDAELADGDVLVAMPHLETTGDETFDFVDADGEDDGPYVADGEPVVDDATMTLVDEDEDDEE